MKNLSLLLNFLLLSFCSNGQERIIPDYKGEKESFSKLKDKTIRKEISTFTIAGDGKNKSEDKLKELPLTNFGDNFSTFEKDSVFVKIVIEKFNKTKHKIKFINGQAVKIDNKPIWGADGNLPKQQINSIFFKIGKDTVLIPTSAYADLFEPGLKWKKANEMKGMLSVYYSRDKARFYISMGNGDGAGFYEATLIIKDKKYFGRVVDTGF